MMSNRFVLIFTLLSLLNIRYVIGDSSSKTSCLLPSKFKNSYDFNWESRKNEWKNTKSQTDYLVLSLSWSPTYCSSLSNTIRNNEFQCSQKDSFDFVVHGLWPQTAGVSSIRDQPRNCRNDQQLPYSTIKRFYCIMPDEDLMQAEWEKHGSCYYSTPLDYFETIEYLFNRLNIPNIRSIKQPTIYSIKNAFVNSNSQLFPSAIYVYMNNENRLEEIRICYNLQYQFINCKQ